MPSSFLLLLPLVGGYLFNHICHIGRFRSQSLMGHRLVFEAAVTGLIFLGGARVLTVSLMLLRVPHWLIKLWPVLTNGTQFVGTSILAVVLAPVCAGLINLTTGYRHRDRAQLPEGRAPLSIRKLTRSWRASRDWALSKAIQWSGNSFQRMLHDIAINGPLDGRAVGLTMSNRKVYAGWVTTSPNLLPTDEHVSLLPIISGHRDPGTLEINYDFAYPIEKFAQMAQHSEVVVALPVGDIVSAHMLDVDYFSNVLGKLRGNTSQ